MPCSYRRGNRYIEQASKRLHQLEIPTQGRNQRTPSPGAPRCEPSRTSVFIASEVALGQHNIIIRPQLGIAGSTSLSSKKSFHSGPRWRTACPALVIKIHSARR